MKHAQSAPVFGGSPESFRGSPTQSRNIFKRSVCHVAVAGDGHTPTTAKSNFGVRVFNRHQEFSVVFSGVVEKTQRSWMQRLRGSANLRPPEKLQAAHESGLLKEKNSIHLARSQPCLKPGLVVGAWPFSGGLLAIYRSCCLDVGDSTCRAFRCFHFQIIEIFKLENVSVNFLLHRLTPRKCDHIFASVPQITEPRP